LFSVLCGVGVFFRFRDLGLILVMFTGLSEQIMWFLLL